MLRFCTYWLVLLGGLALSSCAERYYLPTVINPIALEQPKEVVLSGGQGLLGPLPINGIDGQVAYSPLAHVGLGVSGTYYHPFDDRLWKASGDVFIGGYGKLNPDVQWNVYALAGRAHSYYKPELVPLDFFVFDDIPGPEGAEDGYVNLTLNRYAIWPSLRITDVANMSCQLGARFGYIGIERVELVGPLRQHEINRHKEFGRETPFRYLDLCATFQFNKFGPHRFTLTGIFTASPDYFPTESLTLTIGYAYRVGARNEDRAERSRRRKSPRRKRLE